MLHHLKWSRSIAVFLMIVCLGIFVVGVSISANEVHASHDAPLLPTATPTTYYPWGIHGTVTDEQGNPLSGALVRIANDLSYTQWNGKYSFGNLAPGTYDITVEYYGSAVFTPTVRTVVLPPSAENVDFQKLPPVTTHSIFGRITDHTGTGVPFVKITTDYGEYVSDAGGSYTIHGLLAGTHHVTATSESMVFTPTMQTVTLPQEAPQSVDFTQQCESPNTGLNVCILEVGDILFWRGEYHWLKTTQEFFARILVGTYWFHTAIYLGNGMVAEATGSSNPPTEQVETNLLVTTGWWTQSNQTSYDWSVVRPRANATTKQRAANYALQMANQEDPPILYDAISDRETNSPTYCSKLVWKAYMQAGVNLERDYGVLGATVFEDVITPDDLYYSSVDFVGGPEALSNVIQEKDELQNNRVIFFLLSPADLLLTDSLGRRVGHDPVTHITYDEIPGAAYTGFNAEPESISLQMSTELTWTLDTAGTDDGGHFSIETALLGESMIVTDTISDFIEPLEVKRYIFSNDSNDLSDLLQQVPPLPEIHYIYLPYISVGK